MNRCRCCAALRCGLSPKCSTAPFCTFPQYDEAILSVLADEEGLTNVAIVTNMDFGHTDPMLVLPYAVMAEIDCDRRTVSILENAVSD